MRLHYQDPAASVYQGDGLAVIGWLGLTGVSAVITDPPYNLRAEDIALEGRKAMVRDFGDWDEGWRPGPLLDLCQAILRPGGSVLAFSSDRLLSAYRDHPGLKARSTLVWAKSNPPPNPRPGYVQATEFAVWLQQPGGAATWNGNGYTLNILRHPSCPPSERLGHPTQKPLSLMLELIERHTSPGDLIVDPYMGSGTTLVAAKLLGRLAVGVDLDPSYCEMAAVRLQEVLA